MYRLIGMAGLGAALVCSAASADPLLAQPQLYAYAGIQFGGPARRAEPLNLGFALRSARSSPAAPALAQMEWASVDGLAQARLGGLSLIRVSTRLSQTEGTQPQTESTGTQIGQVLEGAGIGLGTVVLAGGAAVALMLASAGGGGDGGNSHSGSSGDGSNSGVLSVHSSPNGTCVSTVPPIEPQCVPPPPCPLPLCGQGGGFVALPGERRALQDAERDFDRRRWLDAGTGQMGDLPAR